MARKSLPKAVIDEALRRCQDSNFPEQDFQVRDRLKMLFFPFSIFFQECFTQRGEEGHFILAISIRSDRRVKSSWPRSRASRQFAGAPSRVQSLHCSKRWRLARGLTRCLS